MSKFNVERNNKNLRDGFLFDLHRTRLYRDGNPGTVNSCHDVLRPEAILHERNFFDGENPVQLIRFFRFELVGLDCLSLESSIREGRSGVIADDLSIGLLFSRNGLLFFAVKAEVIPTPDCIRPCKLNGRVFNIAAILFEPKFIPGLSVKNRSLRNYVVIAPSRLTR